MSIQENLAFVRQNIHDLKEQLSIPYEITMIAVSKQKPVEDILEAIQAGQRVFGENRIQEAVDKIPLIPYPELEWHFIGHLQANKIKKAVELFNVIHSVDQIETAYEISKRCVEIEKKMNIFIQVNTTKESQKSGISPDRLEELIKEILSIPRLEIQGLMTLGPLTNDEKTIRSSFRLLRTLRDTLKDRYPLLRYLSMGMSSDYGIAISESATHIRLGTTIFGTRLKH
jgi:hypothetical protein